MYSCIKPEAKNTEMEANAKAIDLGCLTFFVKKRSVKMYVGRNGKAIHVDLKRRCQRTDQRSSNVEESIGL